jgi:predicted dehydrogenase/nucleoside-diphosphate-sugar epimerase
VRRFILVSSIVVYDKRGLDRRATIDESAPLLPPEPGAGAYARGKLAAEALARDHAAAGGRMQIVVARPGLIYAADRLTFSHLGELVGGMRVAYGAPSLPLPLVEVHSCVDALVRLATSEAAAGNTYHIVDAHRTTRADYLEALAQHTGFRQRVVYVPAAPVAAAASVAAGMLRRLGKAGDMSADKVRARAVEVAYDTQALQRATEWQPLSSLSEGLSRHGIGASRGPARSIERVGIVGAGMIAGIHLAALARIRGARVVGVLDTNHAAAQALAARVPGAQAYCDPQLFYAEAQPQVVHVLTPPRSHAAVALDALRNGAHVLLEKPAATSLHECDALLEAADRLGLTIGVDETVAWDPRIRRARSALLHGVLGELVHVEAFMSYDMRRGKRSVPGAPPAWDRLLAGGPLEDLLPHPLSVVRALCGPLGLRHVESLTTGRFGGNFPDELRLGLGAGTVTASVALSLSSRPDDFLVTVHGTRATARIDVQNMLLDLVTPLPGPRAASRGLRTLRSALRGLMWTPINAAAVAIGRAPPPASPIHLIAAHHAALARGEPPPAPLAEARADVAITRAIWPEHKPAALMAVPKPARSAPDATTASARGERM